MPGKLSEYLHQILHQSRNKFDRSISPNPTFQLGSFAASIVWHWSVYILEVDLEKRNKLLPQAYDPFWSKQLPEHTLTVDGKGLFIFIVVDQGTPQAERNRKWRHSTVSKNVKKWITSSAFQSPSLLPFRFNETSHRQKWRLCSEDSYRPQAHGKRLEEKPYRLRHGEVTRKQEVNSLCTGDRLRALNNGSGSEV